MCSSVSQRFKHGFGPSVNVIRVRLPLHDSNTEEIPGPGPVPKLREE